MVCVLDCVLDVGVGCGELLCFGAVLWIIAWILGCALCVAGLEGLNS